MPSDNSVLNKALWIIELKKQELRDAANRVGITRSVRATYQAELLLQASDALGVVIETSGDDELFDLSALRARQQRSMPAPAMKLLQHIVDHFLNMGLKNSGMELLGLPPDQVATDLCDYCDVFEGQYSPTLVLCCADWAKRQDPVAVAEEEQRNAPIG